MPYKKSIFAIVLACALAAGIITKAIVSPPKELTTATVLTVQNSLPDIALIDQRGNQVTIDTFRGHWSLVFFGFANCPDICPVTLQTLATSIRQLRAAGETTLPRIVFVSVDPERDTPQQLEQYVAHFGDDTLGVTGQIDSLKVLTSAWGIYFEKQPSDANGESYSVDHSAAVLVVNPAAELHALFSGPHLVENFVHDLPIIMASQ
jgi:protein SCO1/2